LDSGQPHRDLGLCWILRNAKLGGPSVWG
jgi:hypothetical protein